MKRLFFLFLVGAGIALAQPNTTCFGASGSTYPCSVIATPTLAQAVVGNKSSGNVASLGVVFGSNNTAGNSIVIVVSVGNNTVPTISDTNSNVYVQAGPSACNSTTFCLYEFIAVNVAAGANTVTINNGGTAVSIAGAVYEWKGLITATTTVGGTAAADRVATGTSNNGSATGTALFTGNISTNANHIAIAGFAVGTAAQTITVTSPYTNDSGQQNPTTPNGLFSFASASNYITGLSPTGASATITSEPWAAIIVAYRAVTMPIVGAVQPINGDPCGNSVWTYYPINVAANTQVVAGAAGKNVYVCKVFLAPVAAAANFNLEESATSGNTCATSPTGMMGGATAVLGAQMATNGGFVLPADGRAWMQTATVGDAMCIFASAQVTGVLAYVQQ